MTSTASVPALCPFPVITLPIGLGCQLVQADPSNGVIFKIRGLFIQTPFQNQVRKMGNLIFKAYFFKDDQGRLQVVSNVYFLSRRASSFKKE